MTKGLPPKTDIEDLSAEKDNPGRLSKSTNQPALRPGFRAYMA